MDGVYSTNVTVLLRICPFFVTFFDFFASLQPIKLFNICVRLVSELWFRKLQLGGYENVQYLWLSLKKESQEKNNKEKSQKEKEIKIPN